MYDPAGNWMPDTPLKDWNGVELGANWAQAGCGVAVAKAVVAVDDPPPLCFADAEELHPATTSSGTHISQMSPRRGEIL